MEIDESDLPELPTTAHRAAPPTHVPRPAGHVGAARANGTSRAASSGSASASASATGVSGRTASSGELATRARLAQRPPWGQNGSSKPAKAKPATSSSSRGASLSLLKREAAEAAARRDAAALKLDKASAPAPARTQAQKSPKRKGERNASVYNRLLRESRRSARAPPRREADGPRDALGEREKENDASAFGSLSSRPRAAHTGHTTTEDEDGGYWATTEPEDAWTTDANEEGPRSESRGRAGPGQATDDARRAWLDAGENPTASDADADADAAAAAAAASPSVTSFPTPRPRGSSRALVDAEPDESEGVTGEASEASEASEDEERASVASSSPGESSNRIVAEARAAASEDERPAAAADDDDDSASDSETGEDSF